MLNPQQWNVAFSQLDALRRNIPRSVPEARVEEYHAILHSLQVASRDENLVGFRVPESELKPIVVSARRGTRRSPGHATYSKSKYCDASFFRRQVEALWQYVQRTQPQTSADRTNVDKPKDYWAMSDGELEQLAAKINVPPASMTPSGDWYIDRDRIIDALLKRDRALRQSQPSQVIHVNGDMYGSSIQQGTVGSSATINFKSIEADVKNILARIRNSVDEIDLSPDAKAQLSADANTIEAQLQSPHPKPAVITECLRSARTILEGAAGSVIASGIVFEIAKLLAHH